MSAADWKMYNRGVPYTASEAEKLKEVEGRVFNLFDLEAAWPLVPAMPIHQATADMKPFFPADGYGRSAAIVMLDEAVAENRRRVEECAFLLKTAYPPLVGYAYNATDRKAKTAKNKRRSRARWRRREARRLEQELLCMRTGGDPEREASEFAAHALPALAPELAVVVTGSESEKGKPEPGANPLAIFCGERFRRPDEIARMNADQRRAVDDDAGLVPLPSKSAEPEPRPYVPMKWGEHD